MRALLGGLALVVFASAAASGGLVPLQESPAGKADETYQHVRCAGFYMANVAWEGEALGKGFVAVSEQAISALLVIAAHKRAAREDGDAEQLAQRVKAEAMEIADLYAIDFRLNFALRGNAWDGNPLWESDARICKLLAELTLTLRAELEQGAQK